MRKVSECRSEAFVLRRPFTNADSHATRMKLSLEVLTHLPVATNVQP